MSYVAQSTTPAAATTPTSPVNTSPPLAEGIIIKNVKYIIY